ncbi:P-selectin isoform X4 [Hydra vulgaris]|uniref:P-selectin isoform X4 n=1 Tax=Hydra vulgaris TaxID=6087 RepID=A0ABM4CHT9_HYDVU
MTPEFQVIIQCFFYTAFAQFYKCKNSYVELQRLNKTLIGPLPIYENKKEKYAYEERVTFRCPPGYHLSAASLQFYGEAIYTVCLIEGLWSHPWPSCRGVNENVTCENEYMINPSNHRLKPSENEVRAMYSDHRLLYPHQFTIKFHCPKDMTLLNTNGLSVMVSSCGDNGVWTREWPMCQGNICPYFSITNGNVTESYSKRSVGLTLNITCESGYYLWGKNTTECLSSLKWSSVAECIPMETFKRYCEKKRATMRISIENGTLIPYCQITPLATAKSSIGIVGISVIIVLVILCLLVGAFLIVRRHRQQILQTVNLQNSEHNNYNETNCLVLPSYEEVQKIKYDMPPSFEEIFGSEEKRKKKMKIS